MGLRDRIGSALTGLPAPTESGYRRRPDDGRSPQASRPGQSRAASARSVTSAGGRASQLTIAGSSTSSPQPQSRPRQLAIQGSSTSTATKASHQNTSTGFNSNLATNGALPRTTASGVSRPYGNGGTQEAFASNPPRRLAIEGPSRTPNAGCTAASRIANRANVAAEPRYRSSEEGNDLAPLSEREILDVTDDHNPSPAGSSTRGQVFEGAQQNRSQPATRASGPLRAAAAPQRNTPLTRGASSGRLGDQAPAYTTANPAQTGNRQAASQQGYQPINRSQAGRSGPVPPGVSGNDTEQSQALYLGVFDLEETDQSPQQPTINNRGGPSQRDSSIRPGRFNQRSTSSRSSASIHHTTVIDHGYRSPCWRSCDYFYRPYCWGYHWGLPWYPHAHVILPRQTVFTEVSTDYFEQESPAAPNLDTNTGREVINRYYNGWRDAYTNALSSSVGISAADRSRIESIRQKLQSRQDEAIRRLRSGDQSVVQQTLDQVKVDRQMAVDMPVTQIRWATPWIREVWVKEHGDIPE